MAFTECHSLFNGKLSLPLPKCLDTILLGELWRGRRYYIHNEYLIFRENTFTPATIIEGRNFLRSLYLTLSNNAGT